MLAGVVIVTNPGGLYSELALESLITSWRQSTRISYVVGFGENSPLQPHRRAASGTGWESLTLRMLTNIS